MILNLLDLLTNWSNVIYLSNYAVTDNGLLATAKHSKHLFKNGHLPSYVIHQMIAQSAMLTVLSMGDSTDEYSNKLFFLGSLDMRFKRAIVEDTILQIDVRRKLYTIDHQLVFDGDIRSSEKNLYARFKGSICLCVA